jgi:MFS family permease
VRFRAAFAGASFRDPVLRACSQAGLVNNLNDALAGWLSDATGRKPLIRTGMLLQAGALVVLVAGEGSFPPSFAAAVLLGVGTAMVYPTLLAAVSDRVRPQERPLAVGVYRFWRDFGFVCGALIAGFGADATSASTAIAIVAALTAVSGLAVAATAWTEPTKAPASARAVSG